MEEPARSRGTGVALVNLGELFAPDQAAEEALRVSEILR
jgi:hypothetical protein